MWRRLVAYMRFDGLGPGLKVNPLKARTSPRVTPLAEVPFDPNPGNLRMFRYLPRGLKAGAPLVVVLHGCGQTASGYDLGAGWCQLADQLGFAVLAPEQKAVNNPNTCFNWFNPEDITRGQGEAASIAAMIQTVIETHRLDAGRVFITGLSAGGAMASVMLATYPEHFAGGAIIAGLPFGAAANVRDALESMRSAPLKTPHQWGDAVRAASDYRGPWPRISIWHGAMDAVVNINNAQASVAQWADLHGLSLGAAKQEMVDGAIRLRWDSRLEIYTLGALGHGTPIDASDLGQSGPFILDAGISSTRRIAEFWGLVPAAASKPAPQSVPKPAPPARVTPTPQRVYVKKMPTQETAQQEQAKTVEGVIRRALKAAGLLR
ncbi:MAG: PHB depolymerase family esterase [Alphaproteobacteria bacterium]|nr:PHB depolymerase family esterase [Alphaproteobacteria bacterium]